MKLYAYMRKSDKHMVSLNPEYGIEVTALAQLADRVKDTNPELYNILTILIASILANTEATLLAHCNKYLTEQAYTEKLKKTINDMLDEYKDRHDDQDLDSFGY